MWRQLYFYFAVLSCDPDNDPQKQYLHDNFETWKRKARVVVSLERIRHGDDKRTVDGHVRIRNRYEIRTPHHPHG